MKNYQIVAEYLADVICDNCTVDTANNDPNHRCRADADSCIDGTNCEDYTATCACEICAEILA